MKLAFKIMLCVAVALLASTLFIGPASATTTYFDGFETGNGTGDFGAWITGGTGSHTESIPNTNTITGTYSGLFQTSGSGDKGSYIETPSNVVVGNKNYLRFNISANTMPAQNDNYYFFGMTNTGVCVVLWYRNSGLYWGLLNSSSSYTWESSPSNPVANQVYNLCFLMDKQNGRISLWVDNTFKVSTPTTDYNGVTSQGFRLGCPLTNLGTNTAITFDDISYIVDPSEAQAVALNLQYQTAASWQTLPSLNLKLATAMTSGQTWVARSSWAALATPSLSSGFSWQTDTTLTQGLIPQAIELVLAWVSGTVFQANFPVDIAFDNGLVIGGLIAVIIFAPVIALIAYKLSSRE